MNNLIIGILVSIAAATSTFAPAQEYPQTFKVSEIDEQNDMIYLETFTGHVYSCKGVEDWQENDIAAAIMNDNGTPEDITDDVIVDLRYSGYVR